MNHLPAAVDECVEYSRLIGSDPTLVLHGGGNSSVKARWRDITGREVDVLFVKGSGCEMSTIRAADFAPLALRRLRELLELESLTDTQMMRELAAASLDPEAPRPSVESLLHAFLPFAAVQHSHADAIVTLTNAADGERIVEDVLGDRVIVVPYVMPGFDLAREVRRVWEEQPRVEARGMALMKHGLVTFGPTSREAYEQHVELLRLAEAWLQEHAPLPETEPAPLPDVSLAELADLRRDVSRVAGRPLVLQRHTDGVVRRFVARPDIRALTAKGPLTPDHVIRTKPAPLVGRDVDVFADSYSAYFDEHSRRLDTRLEMLDPAPRVILDPEIGMVTAGSAAHEAQVVADIYHHTMPVLERAEDHLGGYVGLPPERLFEVEYWELEQAKLRRSGEPSPLAGAVAVVTGAASGIGRACAEALLACGVAVAGVDLSPEIETCFTGPAWRGVVADVTDAGAIQAALKETVESFGGVDIAVVSAGIFGPSTPIAKLTDDEWRSVLSINVDSVARLLRVLHPLLSRAAIGGRVVVIGSRNVAAPGPGVAAYSASKAALTQLSRVAALEWAGDGIRVNLVHPDGVFDTRLRTPEMIAARAREYGVDVETYRRRNLLRTEVTSADVARAVVAFCNDTFAMTTGAQIPIDGGNERVV